jgi:hypothetical protein
VTDSTHSDVKLAPITGTCTKLSRPDSCWLELDSIASAEKRMSLQLEAQ